MHFQTTLAALALTILSLSSNTAAALTVSCAVCAPSIVFGGKTLTLSVFFEEQGNTVQCNYDTPAIQGFNPNCLYQNINGQLIFTNTGATLTSLPGACPATLPLVQQPSPCKGSGSPIAG